MLAFIRCGKSTGTGIKSTYIEVQHRTEQVALNTLVSDGSVHIPALQLPTYVILQEVIY